MPQPTTESQSSAPSRRELMLTGLGVAGMGLLGCRSAGAAPNGTAFSSTQRVRPNTGESTDVDEEIFNFALNLEYLEAEYYSRGAYGKPLEAWGVEVGRDPGSVNGGHPVNFSNPAFREYAEELASNEVAHVRFYHRSLGEKAVSRPVIDFESGFSKAAQAAGLVPAGGVFDPFENEVNFFLGGMLFEDVGVTAYNGAIPLITSKKALQAAAGILGAEAYHMGMVRSLLYRAGERARKAANAISDARDRLGGEPGKDQGISVGSEKALPILLQGAAAAGEHANIVPSDNDAICFHRTPRQVLNIVYLEPGASAGGFYPEGFRGDFSALLTGDTAQARAVRVVATHYSFDPSTITARPGEKLTITLVNSADHPHNMEFELPGGEVEFETNVPPGGSGTLSFTTPKKPGRYLFYCPVANHRERGMTGTLIVEGGSTERP